MERHRSRIHHRHQVRAGRAGTSPCPLVAVRKDFGLTYRAKDNSNKTPLCIHRAPLGTHERFIDFLIEHYAGNFPLWLAPDQMHVITLNDDEALIAYAKPLVAELRANMVRVDADFSATPFKAKIANAERWESIPPPHVGGYGSSSAGVTWKPAKFPCACTTAVRKARSRRARSWRIFSRAPKGGGREQRSGVAS